MPVGSRIFTSVSETYYFSVACLLYVRPTFIVYSGFYWFVVTVVLLLLLDPIFMPFILDLSQGNRD